MAVIILTAILFFTSVQRPVHLQQEGSANLGQVAADTLAILRTHQFDSGNLTTWVQKVADGDPSAQSEVDAFLVQVVPTGARYDLRINNGFGTLHLLPVGGAGQPSNAQAAETPLFPAWKIYANKTAANTRWPGQQLFAPAAGTSGVLYNFTQASIIKCIRAPIPSKTTPTIGSQFAPGANVTWLSIWQGQTPGQERVPANAPYGVWAGYTAACSNPPQGTAYYARVALPAVPSTTPDDVPMYGLQLVVWYGA